MRKASAFAEGQRQCYYRDALYLIRMIQVCLLIEQFGTNELFWPFELLLSSVFKWDCLQALPS